MAAKPSRKARQERGCQAQVGFPVCVALAPQGIALLGRVHVGQGPSSGQSNGIESSSKQSWGLQHFCREFLKRSREEWPMEMAEIKQPFGARRAPSWQRQPWKTSTNLEV